VCDEHYVVNTVRHTTDAVSSPVLPIAELGQLENLRLELRRGCLVLAVLAQLRAEHYGYTLKRALAARGLTVEEGTLYPLLRRLETQGLLVSEWRQEDSREKRFYRLSETGLRIVDLLAAEWRSLNAALGRIIEDA
jgi:PadR family transcriptional regulator PadR